MGGVRLAVVWVLAVLLPGCTAPFATRQADLFRAPPPLLPTDANAFWNDRASGTYGELTVGAARYSRGGGTCRTARITSIDEAAHRMDDRTVLYCAAADGAFRLDSSLSCRAAAGTADLACRDASGDVVPLVPL